MAFGSMTSRFLLEQNFSCLLMFLAVGSEELTDKVSAGANYLGTFFSSAWSKTTKTANDATTSSSSFLTSAFGKVGGSTANSSTGK